MKFRRLLERHDLARAIFDEVQVVLREKGLLLQEGRMVDATLIHVATDLQGIVEAVEVTAAKVTAAKVPDHKALDALLTGEEQVVLADRGYDYPSVHERLTAQGTRDAVALRRTPGQRKGLAALKRYNRSVARIRARGEHAFRVLKCQFGYRKARYRGIAKNGAQITTLFALANLYLLRRRRLAA